MASLLGQRERLEVIHKIDIDGINQEQIKRGHRGFN